MIEDFLTESCHGLLLQSLHFCNPHNLNDRNYRISNPIVNDLPTIHFVENIVAELLLRWLLDRGKTETEYFGALFEASPERF